MFHPKSGNSSSAQSSKLIWEPADTSMIYVPQQPDSYNCGAYVCEFSRYIAADLTLTKPSFTLSTSSKNNSDTNKSAITSMRLRGRVLLSIMHNDIWKYDEPFDDTQQLKKKKNNSKS
jgi:hypothetical protein